MPNLLQKASIVLTPTAYDDGKVLCAKPSEAPYGDFDFSRSSAATRVNAQGLVENVQTLSNNLVQNGDFSELGAEEIKNGAFARQGTEIGDNSTISNLGTAIMTKLSPLNYNATSDGGESTIRPRLSLNDVTQGKFYRIRVSGSNQSGNVNFKLYNGSEYVITGNDLTTDIDLYFKAEGATFLAFDGSNSFNVDFTISLVEVGQFWTFETGWGVGEDKAISDGSGSLPNTDLIQGSVFTSGNTYKISLEIGDYVSGNLQLQNNTTNFPQLNGTHTIYYTAGAGQSLILRSLSFIGSITNISVKEVGQNWTLQTGWSIENNKAVVTNAPSLYQRLTQPSLSFNLNTTYKISITCSEHSSGFVYLRKPRGAEPDTSLRIDSVGTFVFTLNALTELTEFALAIGALGTDLSITNIEIIEITDDTNLPRINYEGFSYQDALGSEEVVNGDYNESGIGNVISQSGGVLVNENNQLKITSNGSSGFSRGVWDTNGSEGQQFLIKADIISVSGSVRFINISDNQGQSLTQGTTFSAIITLGSATKQVGFGGLSDTSFELIIDNVSIKEYSGQEVVLDSGCGHWLWEPETLQLLPYSEDFSWAGWTKGSDISVESGYLAPDGNNTAYKVTKTGTAAPYLTRNQSLITTTTRSIYARSISGTGTATLLSHNSNTNNTFTLTEQWQRFELNNTASSSGLGTFYAADFRGGGTLTEYLIWGANATNDQDYATSYIQTDGSSATRNRDVCINGGSLASINSEEGVLYAEIAALNDLGNNGNITLSDGGGTNRIYIYYLIDNKISVIYNINSSGALINDFSISDRTEQTKIAVRWGNSNLSIFINGVSVLNNPSSNFLPNTLNILNFAKPGGGGNFNGKTKCVAVWKEALSDEELTLLTAPDPVAPTFTLDFDEIANQFTFSRASFGTIVNEEGLIETVSNIGPDEIVNGDFATDSDWSMQSSWNIANGKASYNGAGNGHYIKQNVPLTIGRKYIAELDILDNSGKFRVSVDGGTASYNNYTKGNGKYSFIFVASSIEFFIRASMGFGSDTLSIDNVSVKEYATDDIPRIDYSTGEKAFLLEPESMNVIEYSNDFANSYWQKFNSGNGVPPVVTSNYAISPDGTQNADRIQFDATTSGSNNDRSRLRATNVSLVDGVDYTVSFYAKSTSGTDQIIGVVFDNSQIITPTITSEWQRFEVTRTQTGTSSLCGFDLRGFYGTTSDILVYGYQIEQQDYATSYIPTDGSSATRAQELCINATPEINSEEGVLYAEIAKNNSLNEKQISIGLSSGGSSNRVLLYFSPNNNNIRCQIRTNRGGGPVVSSFSSSYNLGAQSTDFNKIALKYKENDFSFWVNGIKVAVDTLGLTPVGMDELSFDASTGNSSFFGKTKDLQLFNEALSDYQLKQLTTI